MSRKKKVIGADPKHKSGFAKKVKILKKKGCKRVLDFGCGQGWASVAAKEMEDIEVIGLEIGAKYVKHPDAKDYNIQGNMAPGANVKFYKGFGKLPFETNYFDGMMAIYSIDKDHSGRSGSLDNTKDKEDKEKLKKRMSEIIRVLKDKSKILVSSEHGKRLQKFLTLVNTKKKFNITSC